MADYNSGQFQVAYQVLYSKIKKFMDAQFDVVEELKADTYHATSEKGKKQLEDAENLLKCYEELYHTEPKTVEEIQDVSWLFNGGKLRTNEEISEHDIMTRRREYVNSMRFAGDVLIANVTQYNTDKIIALTTMFLAPILPFIIAMENWERLMPIDGFWMQFDLLYAVSLIIHWIIAGGILFTTNARTDSKIAGYYRKAGKKPPFPVNSVISGATYAIMVASLFGGGKKK